MEWPTPERPLRRGLFNAQWVALAHPTLERTPLEGSVAEQTFRVLPCTECEVATEMDARWAAFQLRYWKARTTQPALRVARYARPSTASKKPKRRSPTKLVPANPITRGLTARSWIEIENYANRVMRFADGVVTLLPDGFTRDIAGRADAMALEHSFVFHDQVLVDPGQPDVIGDIELGRSFEAAAGDVVDGIEPVVIEELSTGRPVVHLRLQVKWETLVGRATLVDERIDAAVLQELFSEVYLRWFTRDYWREKVTKVELTVEGNDKEVFFAYPR